MNKLTEEQLIDILVAECSNTSHFHEPVNALARAGVPNSVEYLESLEKRGLIVRTADVADGPRSKQVYRWARRPERSV
jgi:hypothetical protein